MSETLLPFFNVESVPGYRIEWPAQAPSLLFDVSVKGINVFRDFFAKFRDFFGGETHSHSKVIEQTVEEIMAAMSTKARAYGANAIVGFRLSVMPSPAKNMSLVVVTAIGTPVRLVPESGESQVADVDPTPHRLVRT